MAYLRAAVQAAKLAFYFARYGGELLLFRPATRVGRAAWLNRFSAATLRGMGIRVSVEGEFPTRGAVISNHMGYLDIVIYASLRPCVFCSKIETKSWPVVGWMTTMVGTVYVEQGRGGSALRARGGMEAAAQDGLPVVFFPEGTTSDGTDLLPFKSGLLAQALSVEEPIWAAHVAYTLDEPNGAGIMASQDVAWVGERPLLKHIWRFLGLRGVHAHVRFAPRPIAFVNGADKRKLAAVEARDAVMALHGAGEIETMSVPTINAAR